MSFTTGLDAMIGDVVIKTTDNRGFTPEELADQAVDKIIYVGAESHPLIRAQAEAYKQQIRHILIDYMYRAIRSHNTTTINRLNQAGHPELAGLLN